VIGHDLQLQFVGRKRFAIVTNLADSLGEPGEPLLNSCRVDRASRPYEVLLLNMLIIHAKSFHLLILIRDGCIHAQRTTARVKREPFEPQR
jgi:hypothetical protein